MIQVISFKKKKKIKKRHLTWIQTKGALYDNLTNYEKELVVCHEGDPLWRKGILSNVENMLSLRKVTEVNTEGIEHMVLSLTLRYMKFRVYFTFGFF